MTVPGPNEKRCDQCNGSGWVRKSVFLTQGCSKCNMTGVISVFGEQGDIKIGSQIDLEAGEELCPRCRGMKICSDPNSTEGIVQCPTCFGAGKLDWIERVMGKKDPFLGLTSMAMNTVRVSFPKLIAKELVSVQPMDKPNPQDFIKINVLKTR